MISPSALNITDHLHCSAKKTRSPPPLATSLSLFLSIVSLFFLLSLFLLGGGGSFPPLDEILLAMNKHTAKFTIKIIANYER